MGAFGGAAGARGAEDWELRMNGALRGCGARCGRLAAGAGVGGPVEPSEPADRWPLTPSPAAQQEP